MAKQTDPMIKIKKALDALKAKSAKLHEEVVGLEALVLAVPAAPAEKKPVAAAAKPKAGAAKPAAPKPAAAKADGAKRRGRPAKAK